MKQNISHIGLDVDDAQYHGAAFNKDTGEVIDFKCRPTHEVGGIHKTSVNDPKSAGYATS